MDKLTRSADRIQEQNHENDTVSDLDPIDENEDNTLFREIELNLAPHA